MTAAAQISGYDQDMRVSRVAIADVMFLADLSGVRLPDDVPRFRPTTLIDPPAREKADDNAKPNGSSNRR